MVIQAVMLLTYTTSATQTTYFFNSDGNVGTRDSAVEEKQQLTDSSVT
jgi:hypothetical protein